MTDDQFKIIERLLTDILAAVEKPVQELPRAVAKGAQQPENEQEFGPITTAEITAAFRNGWPMGRDKGKALINVSTSSLEYFLNLPLPSTGSQYYDSNIAQKALVKRWLVELQRLKKENGGKRPDHLKAPPDLPQQPEPEPEEKSIAGEIPF